MRTTLFVTVLLTTCLPGASAKDKDSDGSATFQENCAGCHGPDGRAQTEVGKKVHAADLTAADVQQRSVSELAKFVKTGKGKMPAFQDKLSDDEIRAVVAYVKGLGKSH
jgi:cytochrome c6